jgi:hypothetical protein
MVDFDTILRFVLSLTQPHKISLYGEGCPPLITTIQTILLCNVGFCTPDNAQTMNLDGCIVDFFI